MNKFNGLLIAALSLVACDDATVFDVVPRPPVDAGPAVDADTNVLHEAVGKCGHEGEPCCLGNSINFWESYCDGGSACVGADLSCTDSDGLGTPPPQCGVCGSPDKKYKYFCDAGYPFVETQCLWQSECGFIDASFVPTCISFWEQAYSGRCGAVITSSDAKIDACLNAWDGFSCSDQNAEPPICDNLFFSND